MTERLVWAIVTVDVIVTDSLFRDAWSVETQPLLPWTGFRKNSFLLLHIFSILKLLVCLKVGLKTRRKWIWLSSINDMEYNCQTMHKYDCHPLRIEQILVAKCAILNFLIYYYLKYEWMNECMNEKNNLKRKKERKIKDRNKERQERNSTLYMCICAPTLCRLILSTLSTYCKTVIKSNVSSAWILIGYMVALRAMYREGCDLRRLHEWYIIRCFRSDLCSWLQS